MIKKNNRLSSSQLAVI
ncbi:hypothetical protein ACKP2L_00260 (plasmid) [Oenococcus alcoholitolerans]